MLTRRKLSTVAKDDHANHENLSTQPYRKQPVFNNNDVLTEGWYIICSSAKIRKQQVGSFTIRHQRIVIFRTVSGKLAALDSFCPHMGADLGNGTVNGEHLQCLFHHWSFDLQGKPVDIPHNQDLLTSPKACLHSYPVEEKYGYIWVFSATEAGHPIPHPPGLRNFPVSSLYVRKIKLKVHHHVLMSNAVDLVHFHTLHGLQIKFDYSIKDEKNGVFSWEINGELQKGSLSLRLAKWLFGPEFRYQVIFAGGTITGITLKMPPMFRGRGPSIPPINIIWGAVPTMDGVGQIYNFLVARRHSGVWAPLKRVWAFFVAFFVLSLLRDDDIFVYPHMRFQVGLLTPADASLSQFIKLINKLKISSWEA